MTEIEAQSDNANVRLYSDTNLGTWSSVSDVESFLNRFNHENSYKDGDTKLSVANYVTIQDGTYNAVWMIAGFDMEHNQTAADGTVYDNGYGICMIPKTIVTTGQWKSSTDLTGAYMASTMHTSTLPTIVNNLRNVLGSHIVNRNVLLSSSINSDKKSNAYTWTTAHATLMSTVQIKSTTLGMYMNKYDDGEATYKLPVFGHIDYAIGGDSDFWMRGVRGLGSFYFDWGAISIRNDGYIRDGKVTLNFGIRPLIYLR